MKGSLKLLAEILDFIGSEVNNELSQNWSRDQDWDHY